MKRKRIIIIFSILLFIILIIAGVIIYKNNQEKQRKLEEQKIEARYYEIYKNSYNLIKDGVEVTKINFKNKDEKIIYEYFKSILEEKKSLEQITYNEYIKQNDIVKLYENPSKYIKSMEEYILQFETKKNELNENLNKENFINYLKNNKCSDKSIEILNRKINKNNLKFQSKEIDNIYNSNKENYNNLNEYVSYLTENKNNWSLKDNKLICKTDEVLNYINEKNKTFNINITTEKEKPKVSSSNSKKIPVIMYHGVSDTTWGLEGLFMKVNDFEEQMKYLYDNGYETIFIEDIEKDYTGKKVVALTFDDGYVDFYTNVFPIIKKYNIKTNLYVITSTTSGGKYVNEDQIKELSNSGLVSIGSHTVYHNKLASLDESSIESELKDSKQYLENLIGKEITTICYPSGSYNSKVIDIAKKYYKYGITTINGIQNMGDFSKYKIVRKAMYRSSGMNTFKSIVGSSN